MNQKRQHQGNGFIGNRRATSSAHDHKVKPTADRSTSKRRAFRPRSPAGQAQHVGEAPRDTTDNKRQRRAQGPPSQVTPTGTTLALLPVCRTSRHICRDSYEFVITENRSIFFQQRTAHGAEWQSHREAFFPATRRSSSIRPHCRAERCNALPRRTLLDGFNATGPLGFPRMV